jgi:hypothetical protein
MANNKSRSPAKKKSNLFNPGTLMLGVMFLWLARHEPPVFNIVDVAIWILGAISAALLARAALALVAPGITIAGSVLRRAFQGLQGGAE